MSMRTQHGVFKKEKGKLKKPSLKLSHSHPFADDRLSRTRKLTCPKQNCLALLIEHKEFSYLCTLMRYACSEPLPLAL